MLRLQSWNLSQLQYLPTYHFVFMAAGLLQVDISQHVDKSDDRRQAGALQRRRLVHFEERPGGYNP